VLVVEAELAVLQVQFKGVAGHTFELGALGLGEAPERLDTVDVLLASDKLALAVVDPEVLVEADVDQPVIAAPAVGVDDAADIGGCLRSIWDDLGVDAIAPLEQTKDNRLFKGSPTSLPLNTPRAKV